MIRFYFRSCTTADSAARPGPVALTVRFVLLLRVVALSVSLCENC